jgi:hypothetical protein
MKKKTIRTAIDVLMILLLLVQMTYSLIGERYHEINGTVMLLLFLAHHILNRKWTASVFRGKYTARRMLQTILDLLLLVFMIAQPLSGILMSKYLYTVIQIDNVSAAAREIHLFLGYWGFVLMSIHLGLHMDMMLPAAFRGKAFGLAAVLGVSLYGVYAFIRRELPAYMFRQTIFAFFDYGEPILFFLLDYLAIMILFAALGYGTGSFLRLFSKQKKV